MNNGLGALLIIGCLVIGLFAGLVFSGGTEVIEVEKTIVTEKLVEKDCPVLTCPEVIIPEFKSDERVEDLWENLYGNEIDYVEDEALLVSLDELGLTELEDEFRYTEILNEDVLEDIKDFLEETLEIEIDEINYVKIDNDETKTQITILGLEDDENSEAIVTFEIKVKYDLEEGVDDDFKDKVYVTSNVVLEETDFNDLGFSYEDEDVELVYSM